MKKKEFVNPDGQAGLIDRLMMDGGWPSMYTTPEICSPTVHTVHMIPLRTECRSADAYLSCLEGGGRELATRWIGTKKGREFLWLSLREFYPGLTHAAVSQESPENMQLSPNY